MGLRPCISERLLAKGPGTSISLVAGLGTLPLSLLLGACSSASAPIAPPTPAAAVLSATSITFPSTPVGTSAPAATLTLANSGATPLVLSYYTLSDTTNFGLTDNCTGSLANNATCTLSILFRPQIQGPLSATLTLTDNSGASPHAQQTITFSGVGSPPPVPQAVLSASSLSFPQTITNSSATQTVTLTNPGDGPLTIADIALAGPGASSFALGPTGCGATLAPGASCTETLIYDPRLASPADTATVLFTDNAGNQAGATQSVSLSASALAEVDSVTNFGDSITCGFYAQPNDGTGRVYSTQGYAGLFDTFVGAPAANFCRQGDSAADLSRIWVPFNSSPSASGNQLYTVMIGTNDSYDFGIPAAALTMYAQQVGSALTWLAIPNTDKVLASAITQRTGNWTVENTFGLVSTDAAASLTFPVNQAIAGRNLYLVYHLYSLPYGQAGTASISVDGVPQANIDESQNAVIDLPTVNGTSDTYLVETVPLGPAGQHTVTFTSTGPAGAKVAMLWAGVPQANYAKLDGAPRVLVGAITNSPSGNQSFVAYIYNLTLRSLATSLATDGMNITVVPTDQVLDPNTDFADILHPNNQGHAKLAAVFEGFR